MSFAFGKQIAYCYRRAAECRELALRYCAVETESTTSDGSRLGSSWRAAMNPNSALTEG
jgi:hypothetical protein